MKVVTEALGVSRSNVVERVTAARPRRGPQIRDGDLELAAEIRRLVDQRPTCGHRRSAALLARERRSSSAPPGNAKRVSRLMRTNGLLLARHGGHRRARLHEGKVATLRSNVRWGSDALEFTCWSGEVVRVAFALDCHNREVMGWVASTASLSGKMIRDMRVDCVEARFGLLRLAAGTRPHPVAHGQRRDLRRRQDRRPGAGPPPRALLHPRREPQEQRHGRGPREDPQARLRPREPDPRRGHRPRRHRGLDEGPQHRPSSQPARMPLTTPDAAHHASISTPCRNQPPVRLDGLNSTAHQHGRVSALARS